MENIGVPKATKWEMKKTRLDSLLLLSFHTYLLIHVLVKNHETAIIECVNLSHAEFNLVEIHTVFYPWQLRTYLPMTVPQIIRKNKEKAWNMLLNVKAVWSRITDSKQEISFSASKWLKKITFSLARNLNSNPPKYTRLVVSVTFINNTFFFLETVKRFIHYYKLLIFFESPNATGTVHTMCNFSWLLGAVFKFTCLQFDV